MNAQGWFTLSSESGVPKAAMFPNLKTDSKSVNKTHTQCLREYSFIAKSLNEDGSLGF